MRIAVVGAGAIGCLLAARLPESETVTLIARRPEAAAAIRDDGIEMTDPAGRTLNRTVAATDDPLSVGRQDAVILCVKAHALPGVIGTLSQIAGPETLVVPMVNGIPWWYPQGAGGPLAGRRLVSLDPEGALTGTIPAERIVGAVTYVAVENRGPGRIRHVNNQVFKFGDPTGENPGAARAIAGIFRAGGFAAEAVDDIRSHIWTKLWGNLAFNPISVLTGAGLEAIATDPGTRGVSAKMMEEARRVAERLGVRFAMSIDERIAESAAIGDFKTSMLQDFLAGKRLELDAIVGAVIELAGIVGVAVPTLETVRALTDLRGRTRGNRKGG